MSAAPPVSFVMDEEHVAEGLQDVRQQLQSTEGEVLLDFFFVQQIDSQALRELEELAAAAELKNVKVVLRGIDIEVRKTLELAQLVTRFSFVD